MNNADFGLANHAQKACFNNSGTRVEDIADEVFACYPNPVSSVLYIDLKQKAIAANAIAIWNMNGQRMECPQMISGNSEITIDMDHLSSGIYFLQYNNGKQNYWKKVVKE